VPSVITALFKGEKNSEEAHFPYLLI